MEGSDPPLSELERTRAILLRLYWRAITNMAPPYAPATATAPMAMPTVLAFWLDDVVLPLLFSKTSPPPLLLPLPDEEPLSEPVLPEPDEVEPSTVSPR